MYKDCIVFGPITFEIRRIFVENTEDIMNCEQTIDTGFVL